MSVLLTAGEPQAEWCAVVVQETFRRKKVLTANRETRWRPTVLDYFDPADYESVSRQAEFCLPSPKNKMAAKMAAKIENLGYGSVLASFY